MPVLSRLRAFALASSLVLVACGSGDDGERDGLAATVENCGVEVVFEAPPERVVLLETAPVTSLQALGVLDRVVARAGTYPREYYDDATWEAIEAIPSIGEEIADSGHLQISQEVVLAQEPDLVLGLPDGMTREGLAAVGIPLLVQPAFCPDGGSVSYSFEDVTSQLEVFGTVFGVPDAAADAVADVEARIAAVPAPAAGARRTAAAVFPTPDGTPYVYGGRSFATAQLEAAGLDNVYADVDERMFEATIEDLLDRDPDVMLLLYSEGDPAAIEAVVRGLPGASELTAFRNDDVLVQLFNFTEPPTPLSLDGLERIAARLGAGG